ncbi:helicase associated domain-containing protein [Curtobacterium sp. MCBD17_040]|uniref:helicase associated domain-containing protein n=1 Tax=Curtobacterium sp. MCBD17_040 TaxID=2175674 RepID=UPI0015E8E014|nr:helicase associated domain-containing protein [Curtobacterium sp. MCBD17_040]WIB65348.1 helicase associated domain-containing protein [Curtobacterium sp. MCBD17_040]
MRNTFDFQFDRGVAACASFAAREGHLTIPVDHEEDGVRLNSWIRERRRDRRKGTLNSERAARLEGLPFWSWDGVSGNSRKNLGKPFRAGLTAAMEWTDSGRSLRRIPADTVINGVRLAGWVTRARAAERAGRLSSRHLTALHALPGWDHGRQTREDRWEAGIHALRDFVQEHGHAFVHTRHVTAAGHQLGRFVRDARAAHRRGELDLAKQTVLEGLTGWMWAPPPGRRVTAAG